MIVDEKGRQTIRLNDKAFVYGGASGKKSGPYLLEEGNSYVEITNSCVKNGLVTLGTSSSQQHKEIQMVNPNDTKDIYTLRDLHNRDALSRVYYFIDRMK